MNATGGFPGGDWPTFSSKQPTNGSAFFTGVGDNATNKILLKTTMGSAVTSDGVLAASDNDARMMLRFEIPSDEGTTGVRQVSQRLRYTFTS